MNKLSDAELSLAVARKMWPEYQFCAIREEAYSNDGDILFDYSTDDALGKMAVWLAQDLCCKSESSAKLIVWWCLIQKNPRRALAEAIVEFGQ